MERIVSSDEICLDEDASLRPQRLEEYIGQTNLKENLKEENKDYERMQCTD